MAEQQQIGTSHWFKDRRQLCDRRLLEKLGRFERRVNKERRKKHFQHSQWWLMTNYLDN
jgi:hypothetical protein